MKSGAILVWSIVTGLGQAECGESSLGGRDEFLPEVFVARLSARLARRVFSSSPGAYSQKSHRPSLSEQYF